MNNLVVMLDIQKGLEAFIRLANGAIVFLSGVGTAEEILYLLCILVNENNRKQLTPLVLTGPKSAKSYYQIIIGDPTVAAKYLAQNVSENTQLFNWNLEIQKKLQTEFVPSHNNVAQLKLSRSSTPAQLAVNLRQMFSSTVAGNVKPSVVDSIQSNGGIQDPR